MATLKCPRCGGTNGPGPQKDPVAIYSLEENPICNRCFTTWVLSHIPMMQTVKEPDHEKSER